MGERFVSFSIMALPGIALRRASHPGGDIPLGDLKLDAVANGVFGQEQGIKRLYG